MTLVQHSYIMNNEYFLYLMDGFFRLVHKGHCHITEEAT